MKEKFIRTCCFVKLIRIILHIFETFFLKRKANYYTYYHETNNLHMRKKRERMLVYFLFLSQSHYLPRNVFSKGILRLFIYVYDIESLQLIRDCNCRYYATHTRVTLSGICRTDIMLLIRRAEAFLINHRAMNLYNF